jgi:magnesium transporter
MQSLPQLRPTPGSLDSRRLEERPGQMPNSLYLAGGRAATCMSALVLWPEGPQLCRLNSHQQVEDLLSQRVPIWLRITGMGQPHLIREALEICRIP